MTQSPGTPPTTEADPGTVPAADEVDPVDRIEAAVLAVPGVASLHGGAFGEVGTYLPGRRVQGIRTGPEGTEVHVTVVYGHPVRELAEQVRTAVLGVAPGPVEVTVADLVPAGPSAAGGEPV